MKKIVLLSSCFYLTSAFSQDLAKGDKLFGGSFSFSVFNANSNGPGNYSAGNIGVLPSFSWLIKTNLAMGVRGNVGYNKSTTKYDNGTKRESSSLTTGASVFLKKYKPLKEKFGIYFDNSLGFNYSNYKEKNPPSTDHLKSNVYAANYQFSPGVFYRFSKSFMGEGNIGGAFASYSGGQGTHNFGAGVTFLQYFNLGVNYVIERKKQG